MLSKRRAPIPGRVLSKGQASILGIVLSKGKALFFLFSRFEDGEMWVHTGLEEIDSNTHFSMNALSLSLSLDACTVVVCDAGCCKIDGCASMSSASWFVSLLENLDFFFKFSVSFCFFLFLSLPFPCPPPLSCVNVCVFPFGCSLFFTDAVPVRVGRGRPAQQRHFRDHLLRSSRGIRGGVI